MLRPKAGRPPIVLLPPSLKPTYGNKHTTLATPGYIWVTNTGTDRIERINTTTLEMVSFPSGGRIPSGLAFDGTYLYIVNYGSTSLTKMDTEGNIISITSFGIAIHQVIFVNDALWITDYFSGKVYKVSTITLYPISTYICGQFPLHLTSDGTNIWVACWDYTTVSQGLGKILKLTPENLLIDEFFPCDNPYGIVFDGTHIWVSSFINGNLYELDLSGTVLNSYSLGVADVLNTGLTFVPFTPNLLAVTLTKDFSPHDLPGNYNNCHLINLSDGSLYQLEPLGVDPRNTSVDEFDYAYTAGYGDGSITRFLIGAAPPPEPPTGIQTYNLANAYIMHVDTVSGRLYVSSSSPSGSIVYFTLGTLDATSFAINLDYPSTVTTDGTYVYVDLQGWAVGGLGIAKYDFAGTLVSSFTSGMGRPTRHTTDGTDLLVLSYTDVTLYRVDKTDGTILDSVLLDAIGQYIVVADGYIWVTCANGYIYKINPLLEILASLNITGVEEVIFVGSDLWAVGGSNLYRIDPVTLTILNTYALTGASSSLTLLDSGYIAIPIASTFEILFIDPVDGTVHSSISTGTVPVDKVVGYNNQLYATCFSLGKLLLIS